jgi:opacity protein-like surface antigen
MAVVLTASVGAAQDKGDFSIFAKRAFAAGLAATPLTNTGLGMSYQLTRHVELQPVLRFGTANGHDPDTGAVHRQFDFDLGIRPYYSLRLGKRFVPYVGAELTFSHFDNGHPNWFADEQHTIVFARTPPPPAGWSANNFVLGTAAGARWWFTKRVGVFAEAGVSRTLRHRYVWTGSMWEQAPDHKALRPFRSGFGLVFNLH